MTDDLDIPYLGCNLDIQQFGELREHRERFQALSFDV